MFPTSVEFDPKKLEGTLNWTRKAGDTTTKIRMKTICKYISSSHHYYGRHFVCCSFACDVNPAHSTIAFVCICSSLCSCLTSQHIHNEGNKCSCEPMHVHLYLRAWALHSQELETGAMPVNSNNNNNNNWNEDDDRNTNRNAHRSWKRFDGGKRKKVNIIAFGDRCVGYLWHCEGGVNKSKVNHFVFK